MSVELTTADIDSISPLTDSILEVILSPENYIDYQAGQYLQIESGAEFLSYSIANAPLGSRKYELHIRHEKHSQFSRGLLAEIKNRGQVRVRLPLGDCHLQKLKKNKPIIFIAAGTGFAPVKAMIEQLLADGDSRSFELYWSARSQSDLYMDEKVRHWQSHVSHFRYFSMLPATESKKKLSQRVLAEHPKGLIEHQIILAGPFDRVFATRDALVAEGVPRDHLYSDAFAFENQTR